MSDQRNGLITYLSKVRDNGYVVDQNGVDSKVIELMMEYVGDPDPELRDELICTTFYQWIDTLDYLKEDQLHSLLDVALDERHLFCKIGSGEDHSVFTRTFSVLVVGLILRRHRKKEYLSNEEYVRIKEHLVRYYKSERDLRGYVVPYGWAHGAAHGADALGELALCRESTEAVHREILEAVKFLLMNATHILHHEEDDRIVNVVHMIYSSQLLTTMEMEGWLHDISSELIEGDGYSQRVSRINRKNFIRSLFFRALSCGCSEPFTKAVIAAESRLSLRKQ